MTDSASVLLMLWRARLKTLKVVVCGCGLLGASQAHAASDFAFTAEEYQAYVDFRDGREDPRLASLDESGKREKIAAQLGMSSVKLNEIISRIAPVHAELKPRLEQAITQAIGKTPVAAQFDLVTVNADVGHIVAGIRWKCGTADENAQHASYAAWVVAQHAPLVGTLGVWCVDAQGEKQFSAAIGRSSMVRIDAVAIPRFGTGRYIKLFEHVKVGPQA